MSHFPSRVSFIALKIAILTQPLLAMETFETVTFPSEDDLSITADFYGIEGGSNKPIIALFHQASWSRGEYREIAPQLQAMGFQALAVDQRSGKAVNGVSNLTAERAKAEGKPTAFTDALPDLRAALAYADTLTTGAVLGWGSSYSSSLILKVAAEDPEATAGVLSFSPSEYFPDRQLIQQAAPQLAVPTFITSARSEAGNYATIVAQIPASTPVTTFRPATAGRHGSSALWASTSDNSPAWEQVTAFLDQFLAEEPASLSISSEGLSVTVVGSPQLLERSPDLTHWSGVTVVTESGITDSPLTTPNQFFRLASQDEALVADVVSARATTSSISVGIQSPETGCEQYADWWEILDTEGTLLYRRILSHSHITEQPFVRSGSHALAPNQTVWIRAHMNTTGYGGQAYQGSLEAGFAPASLSPLFALDAAEQAPLPDGCAF